MRTRTATMLLEGLHDSQDEVVWQEFDERFRPVIHGFARQLGLSDADAADVAQESLTRFIKAYRDGRYSRERGRLSSWLIGIARNCISDLYRRRAIRREDQGLSNVLEVDPTRLTQMWEDQCERHLLQQGMDILRSEERVDERTINAFERVVLLEEPPAEVARAMEMSVNAVYIAKNRCLSRLRDIIADLSEAVDESDPQSPGGGGGSG